MNAHEHARGIVESQLPDPYGESLDSLRFKLSFDLYELITDTEIENLKDTVRFSREVENGRPF